MDQLMPRKKRDKAVKTVDYCAATRMQGIEFPAEECVGERHPMPTY